MAKAATTKATKAKDAAEVKTPEVLKQEIATKQQELIDARRGLRAGELQNPRVITKTRKTIARLHTAVRAAELAEKGDK